MKQTSNAVQITIVGNTEYATKEGAVRRRRTQIQTIAPMVTRKLKGIVGMTLVANVNKSVENGIVANRYEVSWYTKHVTKMTFERERQLTNLALVIHAMRSAMYETEIKCKTKQHSDFLFIQ